MTTTTNLEITHLATSQVEKETAVNNGFNILDAVLGDQFTHNMASDADYTLAAGEEVALLIKITDSGVVLTTGRNIVLPNNNRLYIVENATAQTLTFKTAAGTGVAVATTVRALIYCDGTNVIEVVGIAEGEVAYDVAFYISGSPAGSAEVLRIPMTRAVRFPASMTGSDGDAGAAATASTTFTFRKNGSSFATANFAASATAPTWTAATATDFAIGDVLTVDAPASADATLANIGFNLKGTRAVG